jgi:hypothetical protein
MKNLFNLFLIGGITQAQRAPKLPCQHGGKPGNKRVIPIRPDACCGPDLPYSTSIKKCCQNSAETRFQTYNFIQKPDHACCEDIPYDTKTHDCCNNRVVRKDKSECAPCKLSEWTDWSGCELGNDPFAGAFSHRERSFGPRDGFDNSACEADVEFAGETVFNSAFEGNLTSYTAPNEWPKVWSEERSYDEEGDCTETLGARFLNKFLLSDLSTDTRVYRDLLILADESTSIGVDNFQHVKRTLALMIQNLCGGISYDTNRVAMLRYSSDIKLDFDFNGGVHMPKVLRNINRLNYRPITNKHVHGSTYTAHAMEHALKSVFTSEAGWRNGTTGGPEPTRVRTEVVIITDGESNDPDGTFTIHGQKIKYDQIGIKVYALGVGDIQKEEIRVLTSRDDDSIFYLLSWKDLAAFNKVIETLISHQKLNMDQRCLPFEIKHKDGRTPISQARVIQSAIQSHDPDHVPLAGQTLTDIIQNQKKQKNDRRNKKDKKSDNSDEDIEDEFYRLRRSANSLPIAFS